MKLIVRNLDRLTTEDELKVRFQEFGAVQYCNVVFDLESGKSKGFAFIEMPKPGEAKAAMKNLNNKIIGSNKIRVKKAEGNGGRTPNPWLAP
ncbi:RNA-binding protein [Desulfobacter hydrogenophilus]|uniref:RNA-binding protein n=1 Tax=Desulfobacter hydrogenophilus TaxID=2291 RepID=A0A328FFM2_9BACT|nr:RNA-binding protein [Desulfobacter hydrogenophilus]NDY72395.1 RNA-binding protein [Desulfobacter hydrogenophilus]QBH13121.1 RNA-binding protein [Desulfobacter hydrogenophilus]RAM01827.1 RNA-binding protein [Desulfobacter hydrogenophilus]